MRFRLGLILLGWTVALPAYAFTLNYDSSAKREIIGWAESPVSFDYNYSDCPAGISTDSLNNAIDAAMKVWNRAPVSFLELSRGSPVTTDISSALANKTGGNPLIVCDTSFSTRLGVDGDVVPAAAQTLLVDQDYHTAYAILFLNAESDKRGNIAGYEPEKLKIILAHEIGHVLGLGHSSQTNNLMYYDATLKTSLSLGPDDLDGVTYLYPRKEPTQGKAFGCATMADSGNGPGDGGAAAFELALLLAFCSIAGQALKPIKPPPNGPADL